MESTTLTDENSTKQSSRTPRLIIPNNGEENSTIPQDSKKINLDTQSFSLFFTSLVALVIPKVVSTIILNAVKIYQKQNADKLLTAPETPNTSPHPLSHTKAVGANKALG
jgi:hypothetical protein